MLLLPGSANAQTQKELAKAREMFREGLALEAGGNYARALEVFKAIAEVKSTPQVRMHIGECEEKTGDYVRALGSYRLALLDAEAAKLTDIIKVAQGAIEALEPKVPSLRIKRAKGAKVATITLDGRTLGATEINVDVPVNPGPHVIEATQDGRETFREEMDLKDGAKKTIKVTMSEVAETPPSTPPESTPDKPEASSPGSGTRAAGFIIGGLGLVGMGVGAAFLGLRQSTISELESKCGADHRNCPPEAEQLIKDGKFQSNMVTGLFVGGGVVAGIGLVIVLVAPSAKKKEPETSRFNVTPVVTGTHKGVSLQWKF